MERLSLTKKPKSFLSGFCFGCTKPQEPPTSLAQFGQGTHGVHEQGLHSLLFSTPIEGEKHTKK